MADDVITIGYFLEDYAHRQFIPAVVTRLINEQKIRKTIHHDLRNQTGGISASLGELKSFLRDYARANQGAFDITIAAVDGNSEGYNKRKSQILHLQEITGYPGALICAIPDPYVERWYIADPSACKTAIGAPDLPILPKNKNDRKNYKNALMQCIRSAGIISVVGGAEFAEDIVNAMDLYKAGQADPSLGRFIDDMRDALAQLAPSP